MAIACASVFLLATASLSQNADPMKIRFAIDGKQIATATLADNATTRDFVSLLPLAVTLEDYAGAEKISYLPRKLSTAGAPEGSDPSVGDIAYYAPWGNLAIFYKDAGHAKGLVRMGRVDSSIEAFRVPGRPQVTIESIR